MPTSWWEFFKDLGILSGVGATTLLLIVGGVRLMRAQWDSHKKRGARIDAHLEATDILLEDALHRPQSGEIRAASDRAAREERLRHAKERLDECRPRKQS